MELRILENSMYDLIVKGLNAEYKGRLVRINFQDFKNGMQILKLKEYDFDDFEGEVQGFFKGDDNTIFIRINIVSRLFYTDNQEDYEAGIWLNEPLKDCIFPLTFVMGKYFCNKVKLAV